MLGMVIRCLIVDDSRRFLRSARAILESQGAKVDIAATSDEAMLILVANHPEVVLIDVQLGSASGFHLVQRMRDAGYQDPAIIMISAMDRTDLDDLVAASGADGFVPKSGLSMAAVEAVVASTNSRPDDDSSAGAP